jgi:hypothetical protein
MPPEVDRPTVRFRLHRQALQLLEEIGHCLSGPQDQARLTYDGGNGASLVLTFPRAETHGEYPAGQVRPGEHCLIGGVEHLRLASMTADRLSGAPGRVAFVDVDTGTWINVKTTDLVQVLPRQGRSLPLREQQVATDPDVVAGWHARFLHALVALGYAASIPEAQSLVTHADAEALRLAGWLPHEAAMAWHRRSA